MCCAFPKELNNPSFSLHPFNVGRYMSRRGIARVREADVPPTVTAAVNQAPAHPYRQGT